MERREFIRMACMACGALAAAQLLDGCEKYNPDPFVSFSVDLTDSANADLNNVGGYVYKNGVIVMCTATNTYHALSQTCTHAGCTVTYDKNQGDVFCPCHRGTYDLSGNVLSGPPPSPLRLFKVIQNGNVLTITA